jgi:hypothetical protein
MVAKTVRSAGRAADRIAAAGIAVSMPAWSFISRFSP